MGLSSVSPVRALPGLLGLVVALGLALAPPPEREPPRSVYTSLDPDDCRLTDLDEETGSSAHRCPGVAGYALDVMEGDLRVSIDVVAPGGVSYALDYWSVVTSAFSTLGPRAEWRVEGRGRSLRPLALIVRVNASEDPERPERTTSYLAVARVGPGGACVTDRIGPVADANVRAREAADRAAGRPCLGPR